MHRCVALLLVLALVATVQADTRIKVKLTQAGRGKAGASVLLVDASTTQVVDAAALRSPFRGKLSAVPGTYHLVADVARLDGVVGALGPLFAVGDERKLRAKLALAPVTPSVRILVMAAPQTGTSSGAVATMGDVIIMVPSGGQTFDSPFLTVLFNRTQDICGLVWVDTRQFVIEQLDRELDLMAQGRLDPSTPVFNRRIPPTARVEGSFLDNGRTVSGELSLIDVASGRILARRSWSTKRTKFFADYKVWGNEFAEDMVAVLCPSTTTTTPTTASTTTTLGCTTDDDCGPCACCYPGGACGPGAGGGYCCDGPNAVPPFCGDKSQTSCPTNTTCNPPAPLPPTGNYYWCAQCPSGNILEWYGPTVPATPIERPGCTRS
jgi:hypothetical protein